MTEPSGSGYERPEHAVLLLAARRELGADHAAVFRRLVTGPLDWETVLSLANRHRILALLYGSLAREECLESIPPQVSAQLRTAVRNRMARSMALTDELVRILRLFEERGIPAIPCKGPAVAMAAYGNVSMRSFCDLDILVPESHLSIGDEALRALGYRCTIRLTPEQERAYIQNECAFQYCNKGLGHVVELHWRLCERNASVNLPVSEFWHRTHRMTLNGLEVPTLGTEDLLIYLCVHGAKHRWERLEWIACLAEVVRAHPQLDWNLVLQRAAALRVERLLRVGLYLSNWLLGTPLPATVSNLVEGDTTARKLAERVRADLFAPVPEESHYQTRAARYIFMMRSRERWLDRVRILFYSAVRPPHPDANEWINLPPRLAFLHRIFRPVRLFAEYSLVAWRHYLR